MTKSLKIENYALLDGENLIATVSNKLDREQVKHFLHLFATSPELLDFLDDLVAAAIDRVKADIQPIRTTTHVTRHAGIRIYADLTRWLEDAVEVVALAYGENTSIDRDELALIVSGKEERSLQDCDGNIIVRFSKFLKEDAYHDYLNLFIAAPLLLQLLETDLNSEMKALKQGYEDGSRFDPDGAANSQIVVPEYLQMLTAIVARAKGIEPKF